MIRRLRSLWFLVLLGGTALAAHGVGGVARAGFFDLDETSGAPTSCLGSPVCDRFKHLWMLDGTSPPALLEYDGVQWWRHGIDTGLPSDTVRGFKGSGDGYVFVVTPSALVLRDSLAWVRIPTADSLLANLAALAAESRHEVWLVTRSGNLFRWDGDWQLRHAFGGPLPSTAYLEIDGRGKVWLAAERVHSFDDLSGQAGKHPGLVAVPRFPSGTHLTRDASGNIWVGSELQIARVDLNGDSLVVRTPYVELGLDGHWPGVERLAIQGGDVMFAHPSAANGASPIFYLWDGGRFFRIPPPSNTGGGLEPAGVDSSGNQWFVKGSPCNGLARFDGEIHLTLTSWPSRTEYPTRIAPAADGKVWMNGRQGFAGGRVLRDTLTDVAPLSGRTVSEIVPDVFGSTWFMTDSGVVELREESVRVWTPPEVPAIHATSGMRDRDGRLVCGFSNGTVATYDGNRWAISRSSDLYRAEPVNLLAQDSTGGLWCQLATRGLARVQGARIEAQPTCHSRAWPPAAVCDTCATCIYEVDRTPRLLDSIRVRTLDSLLRRLPTPPDGVTYSCSAGYATYLAAPGRMDVSCSCADSSSEYAIELRRLLAWIEDAANNAPPVDDESWTDTLLAIRVDGAAHCGSGSWRVPDGITTRVLVGARPNGGAVLFATHTTASRGERPSPASGTQLLFDRDGDGWLSSNGLWRLRGGEWAPADDGGYRVGGPIAVASDGRIYSTRFILNVPIHSVLMVYQNGRWEDLGVSIPAFTSAIRFDRHDRLWTNTGTCHRFRRSIPTAAVVSGPPRTTGSRSVSFTFASMYSDQLHQSFEWEVRDTTGFRVAEAGPSLATNALVTVPRDGRYWFRVSRIDDRGVPEPLGATYEFVVDATPPFPRIDQAREPVKGPLIVRGTIEDPRLESYAVYLRPRFATCARAETLSTASAGNGVLATRARTDDLVDGRYEVVVEAADEFGLVGVAQSDVVIDNQPPRAEVTSPVFVPWVIGGTVYSDDGTARIEFPRGALPSDVDVVLSALTPRRACTETSGPQSYRVNWGADRLRDGKIATMIIEWSGPATDTLQVLWVSDSGDSTSVGGTTRGRVVDVPIRHAGVYVVTTTSNPRVPTSDLATWTISPRVLELGSGDAPRISFAFNLPAPDRVRIDVYSRSGRHIRTVADAVFSRGAHVVRWDGRSDDGEGIRDDLCLVRVRSSSFESTRTLAIVR